MGRRVKPKTKKYKHWKGRVPTAGKVMTGIRRSVKKKTLKPVKMVRDKAAEKTGKFKSNVKIWEPVRTADEIAASKQTLTSAETTDVEASREEIAKGESKVFENTKDTFAHLDSEVTRIYKCICGKFSTADKMVADLHTRINGIGHTIQEEGA